MEIHSLLYKACESVYKAIPGILAFSAAFSLGHIPAFAIITLNGLLKPLPFVEKAHLFYIFAIWSVFMAEITLWLSR